MDRRTFFSLSGASAVALTARGAPTAPGATCANSTAPGGSPPLKARLGHQIHQATDANLAYLARYGVEGISAAAAITDPARIFATAEEMMRLRERVEKHGLKLDLTDSVLLTSSLIDEEPHPSIMLARSPERDRDIEAFQNHIRACAAAGVPTLKYNMSILGVVRSGTTPGRGDALYSTWRLKDAAPNQPLTRAGVVNADAFWERITYFLERVVPVANEYKVRLACHPQDPGMPPEGYRGVDRVLGTVEGLKKFVSIQESPYHGLNFCQGTVSEDLADPGTQIFDVIRYFGARNKIFNVHFRNIRGHRNEFMEVFPDEGSVDFVAALKVYREIGYGGLLMPDHAPRVSGDVPSAEMQNFAFAFGYIRGLIQSERHAA
ncbi:MAG TPA: mannonate dehydratase [Steroidobacteraceae bacterium]|nr:mannonate dehydratase [Steroidobacteraceae bacterium]